MIFLCISYTRELNEREAANGVTAYSLHPGVIITNIWKGVTGCLGVFVRCCIVPRIKDKTVEQGAATQVYCAIRPDIEGTAAAGACNFYDDCKAREHKRSAECKQKQQELYDATLTWVK